MAGAAMAIQPRHPPRPAAVVHKRSRARAAQRRCCRPAMCAPQDLPDPAGWRARTPIANPPQHHLPAQHRARALAQPGHSRHSCAAALPPAPRLAVRPGRHAVNELAGTGRQHDARRGHAMKSTQTLAQRRVGRVGVARGIGRLHGVQCLGARATSVAVGRKIVQRHACGIGATMHGERHHVGHAPVARATRK